VLEEHVTPDKPRSGAIRGLLCYRAIDDWAPAGAGAQQSGMPDCYGFTGKNRASMI
jgi:hypothetical protein